MHPHGGSATLHLVGIWAAFAVASSLVAMFSGRVSEQLRQREQVLLQMREELAKKERLASLVTLAAGDESGPFQEVLFDAALVSALKIVEKPRRHLPASVRTGIRQSRAR